MRRTKAQHGNKALFACSALVRLPLARCIILAPQVNRILTTCRLRIRIGCDFQSNGCFAVVAIAPALARAPRASLRRRLMQPQDPLTHR